MAGFTTHITVSTTLGVAYGAVAFKHFGLPGPTCILAGTLCSVSGMLPDLDSDSGVPLRESLAFAAACVPMLMMERLPADWSREQIVLVGAAMYLGIRFGIGKLLKKYTVHRGMFHSLPAAAIAFLIAFLVCVTGDLYLRVYKACGVIAGFMSHLILDEIWSVNVKGGIRLKSSFGTAMKFWGDNGWDNLACYGMLALFGVLVMKDPVWVTVSPEAKELHDIASTVVGEFEQHTGGVLPTGTTTWFGSNSPQSTSNGPTNGAPGYPAATYAPPTYAAPANVMPSPYAAPAALPPTYAPPNYPPSPPYAAPQPYIPPQPYGPAQPYAPVQPYVLPPSQQAQGSGYTPYVSPRY